MRVALLLRGPHFFAIKKTNTHVMENYNQSSPKDENRRSGTMPNQYGRQNQPGSDRNQRQSTEMDDDRIMRRGTTSSGYDHPQSSGPSDRPNQQSALYNAGNDDLDDLERADDLDKDLTEVNDLEDGASTMRQNYSNRWADGYVSQGIF